MNILIVDDQPSARRIIRSFLGDLEEIFIFEASTLDEAKGIIDYTVIDIALIDIRLSGECSNQDGLLLVKMLQKKGETVSIVVTQSSEIGLIREAMRCGARDYILKDELCVELIVPVIESFRLQSRLAKEVTDLRKRCAAVDENAVIIGISERMRELDSLIKRIALVDKPVPVLFTGPTGSGKEVFVRRLHQLGAHAQSPFVAVNCSALPEALIESQLFGHKKGAFTGALTSSEGYFATVGKGTLFLDEIAELPLPLQAKLLRAIETRKFRPLGATDELTFEGRIVAATHVDLEESVRQKKFREDLYYRLSVLIVKIPSLESHREDIPLLVSGFTATQHRPLKFSIDALDALSEAHWPGNVRQLKNVIDRIAILTDDHVITEETVKCFINSSASHNQDMLQTVASALLNFDIEDKIEAIENALIVEAMKQASGNKSAAARMLGVHRKVVERRCNDE